MRFLRLLTYTLLTCANLIDAQTSQTPTTPIPCCSVSLTTVPQALRQSWCIAQINTCAELCGGQSRTTVNQCNSNTMAWGCTCSSGLELVEENLRKFNDTLPSQMCFFWYDQCITASGSDISAQFQCVQARDANCGRNATRLLGAVDASSLSRRVSSSATLKATSPSSGSSASSMPAPANSSKSRGSKARKRGPSGGVIVGIVIGAIGGIAIILAIFYFLWRRRSLITSAKTTDGSVASRDDEKEVVVPFATDISHKPELHSHDRPYELEAPVHQHELDSNTSDRADGQSGLQHRSQSSVQSQTSQIQPQIDR